jgi:hypothetical protein
MQGQRCDEEAGHPDLHRVVFEFSDEETFSPIKHQLPPAMTRELFESFTDAAELEEDESVASLGPVPVYGVDGRPGTCLLCSHAMHATDCQRSGCDCRAGVPGG